MKLKLCGIRTPEMVRVCQGGNVDYIGLNFVTDSKRKVLRLPDTSGGHCFKVVGVFRDQSLKFIERMVAEAHLDVIQLHGNEDRAYLEALSTILEKMDQPPVIWKALLVDENFETEKLPEYCKNCDLILFDSKNPGSGKTITNREGLQAALGIVKTSGTKIGIAGGINADNIADFKETFPEAFLLDTASGLEERGDFSVETTRRLIKAFDA